jgi:hypothetical protein
MRFLLTVYDDERRWASVGEAEAKAEVAAYFALDDEAKQRGAYVESGGLHPTDSAKTVRIRDGEQSVTDGPFAETKEQLGGFYLIDVDSEDEALEWAARIPSSRYGRIEVRPLMQIPTQAEAGP